MNDVADAEKENWDRYCGMFEGLKPEQFGQSYRLGGKVYKVVGLEANRRSEKVVKIERADGRPFVCKPSDLHEVEHSLERRGETSFVIGSLAAGEGVVFE